MTEGSRASTLAPQGRRWSPEVSLLVSVALLAFAANSLLCRAALRDGAIDPAGFTVLRIVSGALFLGVLSAWTGTRGAGESDATSSRVGASRVGGSRRAAIALLGYAALFSYAYVRIDAGVGALILFGSVQLTMLAPGLVRGDRPTLAQGLGVLLAFGGLATLVAPLRPDGSSSGVSLIDSVGFSAMGLAGVAWGAYSLWGRGSAHPVRDTAGNFGRAAVLAVPLLFFSNLDALSTRGVSFALVSGVVTSGFGYVVWYRVLPRLTALRAASLQLLVPVIAATLGVALLGESWTPRLIASALAVLAGIALTFRRPRVAR